ncbi:hypothetical protein [Cryptosporangium minutisporangium]|uniref:HAF repeat-containing protein n=1 Tax=Cryptosporangium minutisporangium TaxID=113569 RepID=A0ABP6TEH8_9ACTN
MPAPPPGLSGLPLWKGTVRRRAALPEVVMSLSLVRRSLLLTACATAAGLALSGTAVAAPLQVEPVDLPAPRVPTYAADVNAAGIVVGAAYATNDEGRSGAWAARWQNGALTLLYPPGAMESRATSVNLIGDIGGSAMVDNTTRGFVRRGETLVTVHPPGAVRSTVIDLNERRDALVSWVDSDQATGTRLSLWRNGTFTEITPPGEEVAPALDANQVAYLNTVGQVAAVFRPVGSTGPGEARLWQAGRFTTITRTPARLQALSELGHVVGSLTGQTGNFIAFSWQRGRLTRLPSGTSGVGYAVNERGQVAGEITTADNVIHAALWTGGRLTDLGTLGGQYSTARAIDNLGRVAGTSQTGTPAQPGYVHPFVWQQGTFTDLTPDEVRRTEAHLLTDTGFVVGSRITFSKPVTVSVAVAWRVSTP